MSTQKKCIVLGISGGIAAYKAAVLARELIRADFDVWTVMTKNATEFITSLTMETLTGHPVAVDMFAPKAVVEMEHISLAKRADLFLVAPATANIIGKYANGITDDMLSTTLMATEAPVMIAPAMNTAMLHSAACQHNLKTLCDRGVLVVSSEVGLLACNDIGDGKLAEPEVITAAVKQFFSAKEDLKGLKVLITAGPTREPIDPVRYLTNRSSGKMGFALASAAAARGADVTIVAGPVTQQTPKGVQRIDINTAKEMHGAVIAQMADADIIIKAAAPSDFYAEEISEQKIKKNGEESITLTFRHNPDIAKAVGETKRNGQVLAVFAAESEDLLANAAVKLKRKNADLCIANDITKDGSGFDSDTNAVTLLWPDGHTRAFPQQDKAALADELLDEIKRIHSERNQ